MNKWIRFTLLLLTLSFTPLTFAAEKAILLNIDGPIGPATQDYIERGIDFASKQNASAIIIQLNTPGGLETAMRGINEAIIQSPIPVIAYVAPAGARAASAGTFILYASHLAAMAPGTNLGAAAPVTIGGNQADNAKQPSTVNQKMANDAAASIRSLAQLRGRNAEWAESAVRNAASLSAEEAKKLNVINFISNDLSELMKQIDGQKIKIGKTETTIQTKHAQIDIIAADWQHDFLALITNPNVAYILMLIALYGLFFEFANPGAVLPGVAGVIALLLVLYAFQLMPINYTGLLLIAVGIGFMIAEFYISSFGVLGIGGVIAFMIGSIMLFDMNNPYYQLTWSLAAAMSIVTIAFFMVIATLAIRAHKKKIVSGREALIGSKGIVLAIDNQQITVRILGELWEAKSPERLKIGQHITVTSVHGLVLSVKSIDQHIEKHQE